jgi:hypothetical protein
MLDIIGAAAGAAGGILGGLGKNRALRQQIKALQDQQANVDLWRDQYGNEDGTQSIAAQNVINENARRLSRAARAAAGRRAVTGIDETPELREANAAQTANLLAGVAAAQQERNNSINDKAFEKKQALQSQINELQAQKQSALDIASGAIGGAAKGFGIGMG